MLADIMNPTRKVFDSCLTLGGLAINGAGAATFRTTNALTLAIDGILTSKAALSAQAFSTGHTPQAPKTINGTAYGTTALYLVQCDASGAVSTKQSNIAVAGIGADGKVGGVQMPAGSDQRAALPEPDSGNAAIGFIKVTTNASTTFTPGTTALDAAGLTVTYTNLGFMPANPFQ
jgi:hypothetical protein